MTYRGDAFLIVRGASGLGRASPAERLVFVFQCYLDDSGTSGLPVVTIAGFVAAMHHWEHVEAGANEIMDTYGVPIFHAKQFHDTRAPFGGWTKIKKRTFAEELFSMAHGRIYGLSVTISRKTYEQSKNRDQTMSAIGCGFSVLMTRLLLQDDMRQAIKQQGVAFLLESGNKNNGGIEKFFHQMSKADATEGCLRSISFVQKDSCRAIQMADFLAFYSRRFMHSHARFNGKLALPVCTYLEIMKKHGPVWLQGVHGNPSEPLARFRDLPNLDSLVAVTQRPS